MTYDVIIIGSGPAGLTASIYASRYNLSNLVLGSKKGGTFALAHKVDNWPAEPGSSGAEIMDKVEKQTADLGGEIVYDPVVQVVKLKEMEFKVQTKSGTVYKTKSVIFAPGTERRKLNIKGEAEYLGKGVSYCVTCDAPFFKDKTVVVVGGSDSACSGAVYLSSYAKKIYLIYRKDSLRAEPAWLGQWQKLEDCGQGKFIKNTNLAEIKGDGQRITEVVLDQFFEGKNSLNVDGVFIEIGGVPGSNVAENLGVEVDEKGFVKVDQWMKTNLTGVFSAGDCTNALPGFAQAITASAMGAVAAASVYEYLKKKQAPKILGV